MCRTLASFATCAEDLITKGEIQFAFSTLPDHHPHARYNPDEDDYDPAKMVIKATPADALRVRKWQLEGQLQKLRWTSGAQSSSVRDRSTVEDYEAVAREIEEELRLLDKEQTLNELDKVFFTEEMVNNLEKALVEHMDTKDLQKLRMQSITKGSKLPIIECSTDGSSLSTPNRPHSNTSTTASLATSNEHFENELDKVFFTEKMVSNLDKALMEHMDSNGLQNLRLQSITKSSRQPVINCATDGSAISTPVRSGGESPSNTSTTASLATSYEDFRCEQAL